MSNKHLVLILALSLVGVMGQKNATTYKPGEGDDFNVGDSRGHLISDGFGDCVKIGTWNKDHDLVDCDAVAKWLTGVLRKVMAKSNMDEMLIQFLGNIAYTVLLLAVVMATLDHLGIQTTSLLAVFGAAGLAIGLALKDSLGNFSSGVMIILFRPFKVGDFIEAGGATGVVEQVRMFATIMRSGDNRELIVPNSQIYSGTIVNYSAKETRRIDLVFGIGYGDDIARAKQIIDDIMQQDARILADPAPSIALGELADSSVNFNVRPWVKSGDYWPVRADLLEKVKLAFDANGISIPYPQQELYMHQIA